MRGHLYWKDPIARATNGAPNDNGFFQRAMRLFHINSVKCCATVKGIATHRKRACNRRHCEAVVASQISRIHVRAEVVGILVGGLIHGSGDKEIGSNESRTVKITKLAADSNL